MEKIIEYIKDFFNDISFKEETHTYKVKNKKIKQSVTELVNNFVKFTDFKIIASKIDIKNNLKLGTTALLWKENCSVAANKGTKVHNFANKYFIDKSILPSNGFEESVVNFYNSLSDNVIPVLSELTMFHKEEFYAGTCDLLLYDTTTESFYLVDYKTNKDLFKEQNKYLKKPFDNLIENNFNKYSIQLNYYQKLFEQTGFKIVKKIIVWLKEDNFETFEVQTIDIPKYDFITNNQSNKVSKKRYSKSRNDTKRAT